MKRFVLGEEHAAGWMILDGTAMTTHYFAAGTQEAAQAYVEYRNQINTIQLQQIRDMARAKVEFIAALERIRHA